MAWLSGNPEQFFEANTYDKIFVLTDQKVKRLVYPMVKKMLPAHQLITIPAGEKAKNLETVAQIWAFLSNNLATRKSLLINLGGGVICDLGGFCAATYKRGIDFIQIPTTLLSMVDAAHGGKTGFDFLGYKNQIGAFKAPAQVWVSEIFLKSLPKEELLSGFAEVLKHNLLSDKNAWNTLRKSDFEMLPWSELIRHSIAFKEQVTSEDPFEKGKRKILNLGHTIGHGLETFFLNAQNPILHGFAVAAGLVCEGFIAYKKGYLPKAELDEIEEFIFSNFGKIELGCTHFPEILKLIKQDKKNDSGKIKMALLKNIGNPIWDIEVAPAEISASLKFYFS